MGHKFLEFQPPEIQDQIIELINNLTPDKPSVTYEHYVLITDGSIRWQEWTDQVLFTKAGEVKEFQTVGRDITESKQASEEIQRQRDRAESLLKNAALLNADLDLETVLNTVCEETCSALHVPLSGLLLYNDKSHSFHLAGSSGLPPKVAKSVKPLPRAVYDELVHKLGKSGVVSDLAAVPDLLSVEFLRERGIKHFVYASLKRGNLPMGLLVAGSAGEDYILIEDTPELLSGLADQAASAITNAELFQKLESSNLELLQAYGATIEGWAYALDLKDEETKNHSQRVTEMTLRLAREMGVKDEALGHTRRGALLHDIGKMGIPDAILLKSDPLTEREWAVVHRHPRYAYDMLSPIDYLRPALAIPYCHHEKFDGSGYPRGLKGEHIPLTARIFAVVDVFDALTSDRPYRKAWSREEALDHIKQESGKHFDPQVVAVFLGELNSTG